MGSSIIPSVEKMSGHLRPLYKFQGGNIGSRNPHWRIANGRINTSCMSLASRHNKKTPIKTKKKRGVNWL
jgi:hypothetical protein